MNTTKSTDRSCRVCFIFDCFVLFFIFIIVNSNIIDVDDADRINNRSNNYCRYNKLIINWTSGTIPEITKTSV